MEKTRTTRWRVFILAVVSMVLLWGIFINPLPAAPPTPAPEEGQKLFQQSCAACHTIGQGDRVGPDLKDVTIRREHDWLIRWLLGPDKMLADKDPIATELLAKFNNVPMPNLGLTAEGAAALIAYLERMNQAKPPTPQPGTTSALAASDPIIGKDLFTGTIAFQNGGPSCMACHSIAGIGALGGGALGPDLTEAYSKYGEDGITSILASLPFPTMNPIFSKRPLTPQEQADLKAFLQQVVAKRPTQAIGQLALLSLAGLIVLLMLAQFLWRRRLTGVRRPLVKGR